MEGTELTSPPVQELSREDKEVIFRQATRSLVHWYGDRFENGMTDYELTSALEHALGIMGGSGGPDIPSVTFKGAGLKIWGGWSVVNHLTEKPLFEGKATIAMAREVYGIADLDDKQMQLF